MEHTARGRRPAAMVLVAILLAASPAGSIGTDRLDTLTRALANDRSYKVRLHAAVTLGNLRDRRAFGALVTALEDSHPLVRAMAARSLGLIGDPAGAPVLVTLFDDPSDFVRRRARAAHRQLRRIATRRAATGKAAAAGGITEGLDQSGRPIVAVGTVGDRGGAGAVLRQRMRERVAAELRAVSGIEVLVGPGSAAFVVDGAIRRFSTKSGPGDVEVNCEVELVLSGRRGILITTTGEATVQVPRAMYRPQRQASMEEESLDSAVAAAHENLSRYLAERASMLTSAP